MAYAKEKCIARPEKQLMLSNTLDLRIASLHEDVDMMTEEEELTPVLIKSKPVNEYHPVVDLRFAVEPTRRHERSYMAPSKTSSEKQSLGMTTPPPKRTLNFTSSGRKSLNDTLLTIKRKNADPADKTIHKLRMQNAQLRLEKT